MAYEKRAQETVKLEGNTIIERLIKICFVFAITVVLFISGINISAQPSGGSDTPQKSETGNKADQNLKSIARVNPSTLAMEMSLTLMTYPGRNGNSLPVGFSYSSKIWQMNPNVTWFYFQNGSGAKRYLTDVYSKYADKTAAGWTSMMMPPRIDEILDIYNQYGKPYSEHLNDEIILSFYEQSLESILQGNSSNLLQPCGWRCGQWVAQCSTNPSGGCNGAAGLHCQSIVTLYCQTDGSSETPSQNPDRMHYVKRVRVAMPDGATHEFRKSDKVFGYCAGNNPFGGANCEQQGEDTLGIFLAIDGSGMKLVRDTNGSTLYLPNGSKYIFPINPQNIQGLLATAYIDGDGNKLSFSQSTDSQTSLAVNKWTDTMGREIADPMPYNWDSQTLPNWTLNVNLPGLAGNTQNFKMKWMRLKPAGCEENTNPECGIEGTVVPGALEDQSQKLYYSNPNYCQGNLTTNLTTGEVLFPVTNTGHRSCNQSKIIDVNGTPTEIPARFNPVVLAEVELPNGKKYVFKYNRYGEISKIIYPTGSYETFEYARVDSIADYLTPLFDQLNRGVVERKVYNSSDQLEQRWNYSSVVQDPTNLTSPLVITTVAPHKSDSSIQNEIGRMKSVRYLTRVPQYASGGTYGNFGFDDPRGGMPFDERSYDENGTLRSRTLTEYIVSPAESGGDSRAVRDPRPKRTVSIMIEGDKALATLSELEYDTNGSTDREYFSSLNIKQSKSYHYKSISVSDAQNADLVTIAGYFDSSLLASVAETDYQYNADYKARGIASLPTESRSLNPANPSDILAKTQTIIDNQLPASNSNYTYSTENYTVSTATDSTYDCSNNGAPKICWQNPNSTRLGRATTSRVWNKDTDTWIESHVRYDIFGNAVKVKDAIGNEASTIFTGNYKYAYPETVITPAPDPTNTTGTSQESMATSTYDFTTGLTLTVTALNDLTTSSDDQTVATEYNDTLLRPTRSFANFTAPEAQTIYDDTPAVLVVNGVDVGDGDPVSVKVRKQIDATNWDEAETFFDSFGRAVKTQAKDSQGDVFVETEFDLLGRVKRATNPYRTGDTKLWSKPRYDELGRAVESYAPAIDGQTGDSLGITSYSISDATNFVGTVVTSVDASGRKSRSITNALGQLLRIDEPTATGGTAETDLGSLSSPNQPTYYNYSPQGQMVKVQQGKTGDAAIQYRYFKYDSLGRLIRVRQPEQEVNTNLNLTDSITGNNQWTAGFSYDVLGNVITTTDAKGTVITNTYDKASRVTTRTYSGETGAATPAVSFKYDGKGLDTMPSPNTAKGKLTFVNNGISQTRYLTFDNLGRLTSSEQRTPVNDETIATAEPRVSLYEYNFAGALVKETYPSGRVVQNEFEADGDLSRIYGKANTNGTERTYANSFSYTADGRIEKLKLGNGLWESAKFNTRLQVTEFNLGIGVNDASRWKLQYEYGELNADGSVDTNKNTGNIAKQTSSFAGLTNPFVQTFKYDSLYRLIEAKETVGTNPTPTWKQNFGYDRFGNRTGFINEINGQVQTNNNLTHPTIDANTNRFNTGQGYVFDKNGNLTTDPNGSGRTFTFNGENKQTEVKDASGNPIGKYFYDGEGKRVKKVTNTEITVFVYSNGKLVAEYSTLPPPTNPTTSYTMTDQLDSPRVITNALGEVTSRRDFMPFGEEIAPETNYRTAARKYGTGDNIRQKFTGYQKDTETNLDFAEARMYQNLHGRFTAVDPLLASGKSANPQTFNRYVYVLNNPLVLTDPSGLQAGKWMMPPDPQGGPYVYVYNGQAPPKEDYVEVTARDKRGNLIGSGEGLPSGYVVRFNPNGPSLFRGILVKAAMTDFEYDGYNFIMSDEYRESLVEPVTGVRDVFSPYDVALLFTPFKGSASATTQIPRSGSNPLRFSQRTASSTFSNSEKTPLLFKNKPIEQLSAELNAGAVNPSQVPVDFVQREGVRLIVNTRSSLSLIRANVPTNQWNLVNRTGQTGFERRMTERLFNNNLTNQGTNVIECGGCWWRIP